eukprot:1240707-Ditylum_brightwellii.AAC.1
MALGKGPIYNMSIKQKINMKSSTETKLVGGQQECNVAGNKLENIEWKENKTHQYKILPSAEQSRERRNG